VTASLVTAAYLGSAILFILALGGLSHPERARRGNLFGMIGMSLAVVATILGEVRNNHVLLFGALAVGAVIGLVLARRVRMTGMPELVAILHSFVGLAAVLVGFSGVLGAGAPGSTDAFHAVETCLGVLIGAVTFSGSVVAWGKLSGQIGGRPLLLPARHWLNLLLLLLAISFGALFTSQTVGGSATGVAALAWLTVVALIFGVHMVAAIGGADMPVVISMLNSYSGWAAAATGFLLGNDLLIVTGALVGSSGAILSYIMCRAMNRRFLAVIAGGFGGGAATVTSTPVGEARAIEPDAAAELLAAAKKVVIVPGYGMAVAQAQHAVFELTAALRKRGANVRFAIHPVAGRMPGHMNVLLAEANVPYDIVLELDEINDDFPEVDVSIVIGANDIVNPSAQEEPGSPIAGMPVLEVWKGRQTNVLKRSMATG